MSVIQFDIDDALTQSIGTSAIKTFIEQQVDTLRLQHQGNHIAQVGPGIRNQSCPGSGGNASGSLG